MDDQQRDDSTTPPPAPPTPPPPPQPGPPAARPPASPAYPGAAPAHPTPAPSKGLAVAALVLAVLGFLGITLVAAVVMAIVVLAQRRGGKGLAIAALVVSGVWLLVLVALVAVGLSEQADRDETGSVTETGTTSIMSLRVGDCVEDELDEEVLFTVEVTPCSRPHRLEAYATFELADGDFPGNDEVARLAEGGCFERFEDFVGTGPEESELGVFYVQPVESGWRRDRTVVCLLTVEEPVRGSLQDSGR